MPCCAKEFHPQYGGSSLNRHFGKDSKKKQKKQVK